MSVSEQMEGYISKVAHTSKSSVKDFLFSNQISLQDQPIHPEAREPHNCHFSKEKASSQLAERGTGFVKAEES